MYKIGIIGFGVVGKSVLSFLQENVECNDAHPPDEQNTLPVSLSVWDERVLSDQELELLARHNVSIDSSRTISLRDFIERNNFVIPSPGINVQPFADLSHKFLCELDFFSTFYNGLTISITGSFGKTTITTLLGVLINSVDLLSEANNVPFVAHLPCIDTKKHYKAVIGGNIGIGMLDLIDLDVKTDIAVLELSSFQLALSKKFAPDIGVWSNLYANHLDWHGSYEHYFDSKFNNFRYQTYEQFAVFGQDLFKGDSLSLMNARLSQLRSTLIVCCSGGLDNDFVASIARSFFYVVHVEHDGFVYVSQVCDGIVQPVTVLAPVILFSSVTFLQNWIITAAVLWLMRADFSTLEAKIAMLGEQEVLSDLQHRLELVGTVHGVDFYNDSKSTVIQTTMSAVDKLSAAARPLIVIIGGLSKGADRAPLVEYLKKNTQIKKVYAFGGDCGQFVDFTYCATLEDVFSDLKTIMQPGDQVVLSPSGSSFDLFKNYQHRGEVFKALVQTLAQSEVNRID